MSPTEQLNGTALLAQDKSNSNNNTLNEYYHSLHGDYSISEEMYFILTLILGECALAVYSLLTEDHGQQLLLQPVTQRGASYSIQED